jgi:uncharacterized protein YraI
MPRTILVGVALVLLLAGGVGPAAAGAATGTVRGADAVHVRRGPSAETPPFQVLSRGATVTVERVVGSWVEVVLADGQHGYIKADYLALPAGVEVVAAAETTPVPTPEGAMATAEPTAEEAGRNPLEVELNQLRERLAALESAVGTPSPTAASTAASPEPTRPALPLPTTVAAPADLQDIGPSLALAGVGLAIGFVLGAIYGQRQERNRRSRVRF